MKELKAILDKYRRPENVKICMTPVEHFYAINSYSPAINSLGRKKNFVSTGTVTAISGKLLICRLTLEAMEWRRLRIKHVDVNANIQRGDKITDSDDNVYNVEGINEKAKVAMNEHLEVYLSKISL